MLHGVRFLLSAAAAFARLAHAIVSTGWALFFMPLCSPTSTTTAVPAPWQHLQPARSKVHPAALAVDDGKDQLALQAVSSPPPAAVVVVPVLKQHGDRAAEKTAKAARGKPPRLSIPPPVACAPGVDPFGAAADRETDVATEVEVQGEGFCLASRRGVRHAMEDGYGVITDHTIEGGSQLAFYGVYDGHGGRAAVDFVADKLGKNVVAALAAATTSGLSSSPPPPTTTTSDEDEVVAAIRAAYLTTDSEFLSQGVRGGACAATALVKDGDLYVANVGDCRAVLGSRGGAATALTSDHTAGREDERRRIESSGGYVSCGSSGVWRVQDCLAVSRAFGDASMKPWVTSEPEVSRRRLTPDCRFLVVASDGLWNKVSCQEAVDAVSAAAAAEPSSSVGSCKELVALARSRGSRDDITVMVVDLQRFLQ
ncbi:hypothetical protein SEVIR_7G286900v4 [Setaria viridis]|uniref:protein-serine/threonine phosphatase n=1 Tax=Setaria viridis TaxID=4556 RepID=A0A4U6TW19_SETVI|nr:probable protein phosphatase 2C 77 [Setaria viridis]TKW07120.1 hypothetical protein SEVIR_7G286900v2 [Setaria viridis]